MPLDVMKTRLMNAPPNTYNVSKWCSNTFIHILLSFSPLAFWKNYNYLFLRESTIAQKISQSLDQKDFLRYEYCFYHQFSYNDDRFKRYTILCFLYFSGIFPSICQIRTPDGFDIHFLRTIAISIRQNWQQKYIVCVWACLL